MTIALVWLSTYRRINKDVAKLERKGLLYTLSLNAWLCLFVLQTVYLLVSQPSSIEGNFVTYTGVFIYTVGAAVAVIGRLQIGKSWGLPMQHNVTTQKELITTGIYSFTRNPIYLSEMLMLLGFEIALKSWLVLLVIPFYYWNKTKAVKEESILKKVYGTQYEDYVNKVPRFL